MKRAKIYYWNMYAPHRILRRFIARKIFHWADGKYGVSARGPVRESLDERQLKMLDKWHYWMRVKNKVNNNI